MCMCMSTRLVVTTLFILWYIKLDCDRVSHSSKDYENSLDYIKHVMSDVFLFNFIANIVFFFQIKVSILNTQKSKQFQILGNKNIRDTSDKS